MAVVCPVGYMRRTLSGSFDNIIFPSLVHHWQYPFSGTAVYLIVVCVCMFVSVRERERMSEWVVGESDGAIFIRGWQGERGDPQRRSFSHRHVIYRGDSSARRLQLLLYAAQKSLAGHHDGRGRGGICSVGGSGFCSIAYYIIFIYIHLFVIIIIYIIYDIIIMQAIVLNVSFTVENSYKLLLKKKKKTMNKCCSSCCTTRYLWFDIVHIMSIYLLLYYTEENHRA